MKRGNDLSENETTEAPAALAELKTLQECGIEREVIEGLEVSALIDTWLRLNGMQSRQSLAALLEIPAGSLHAALSNKGSSRSAPVVAAIANLTGIDPERIWPDCRPRVEIRRDYVLVKVRPLQARIAHDSAPARILKGKVFGEIAEKGYLRGYDAVWPEWDVRVPLADTLLVPRKAAAKRPNRKKKANPKPSSRSGTLASEEAAEVRAALGIAEA